MTEQAESNELLARLNELGWSYNKLAVKVAQIRQTDTNRIKTGVIKSIQNPGKASLDSLEAITQAMGGNLSITWVDKRFLKDS